MLHFHHIKNLKKNLKTCKKQKHKDVEDQWWRWKGNGFQTLQEYLHWGDFIIQDVWHLILQHSTLTQYPDYLHHYLNALHVNITAQHSFSLNFPTKSAPSCPC